MAVSTGRVSASQAAAVEDSEVSLSVLRLTGLDCADCAAKMEQKISRVSGIVSAKLNFGASKLTVRHRGDLTKVIRVIEESGYGVEAGSAAAVSGDPAGVAASVTGGAAAGVGSGSASGTASGAASEVTSGVSSGAVSGTASGRASGTSRQRRRILLTAISGAFAALGLVLHAGGVTQELSTAFYLLAMLSGGYESARSGLYALRSLSLDMNFLLVLAAAGAAAIGEWSEAAMVVFLFSLGNSLQAYAMDKTRRSIRSLMDLAPKEATVLREGREIVLPLKEVLVGDRLLVKPGQAIPMDGTVIGGTSGVNQAPITGESLPVAKHPGDPVYAGTLNGEGALEVVATKPLEDTTLARIIELVEDAQENKAPSQQFVDVFARYYTPAVILVAVTLALGAPLIGLPFLPWFKKALILLVISCPCALVISTPVAIVAALGSAAKNGVLIKGGAALEGAGALRVLAFDKTGTLTTGCPEVTDVIPAGGRTPVEVLRAAAAIESRSAHPLAGAVLKAAAVFEADVILRTATGAEAGDQSQDTSGVQAFESLTGRGAKAAIAGQTTYIGSPRLFAELGVAYGPELAEAIDRIQAAGKTVMLVGDDRECHGLIAVADVVRGNSRDAVRRLKKGGLTKTVMLTGDNRATADTIAAQAGVDEVHAELLPENKLAVLRELLGRYAKVGMVGDGVNDAPALAAATVGIAMGGAGTDTALETADIALMADDLGKLPYAITLSRQTLRVIKENIAFSLLVKAVFLLLTFMGLANLWMAVFADTGTALLVILNGLRLFRVKDN